ncbi:MAG: hypothetical protein ACOY4D_13980 [Pseudomonadota bacterium]
MSETIFSHLVEVDEVTRRLTIYRVFANGEKQLFTQVDLPLKTVNEDEKGFEEFSRMLGENLLIDSPVARKLLDI